MSRGPSALTALQRDLAAQREVNARLLAALDGSREVQERLTRELAAARAYVAELIGQVDTLRKEEA